MIGSKVISYFYSNNHLYSDKLENKTGRVLRMSWCVSFITLWFDTRTILCSQYCCTSGVRVGSVLTVLLAASFHSVSSSVSCRGEISRSGYVISNFDPDGKHPTEGPTLTVKNQVAQSKVMQRYSLLDSSLLAFSGYRNTECDV